MAARTAALSRLDAAQQLGRANASLGFVRNIGDARVARAGALGDAGVTYADTLADAWTTATGATNDAQTEFARLLALAGDTHSEIGRASWRERV